MIYLDTSMIVPLFVSETTTARARAWRDSLTTRQSADLAASTWTITEFSSAIGLKVRSRALTADQGNIALALLSEEFLPRVAVVEAEPTDFRLAQAMLAEFSLGLRAGEALHLAIARRAEARQIVTLDAAMAKAAAKVNIPVAPLRA
jgi:uncharacterized protein